MKKNILFVLSVIFLIYFIILFNCQQPSSSGGGSGGNGGGDDGGTYTVTYDGNGNSSGDIPIDSKSYKNGDTVIVKNFTDIRKINVSATSYRFEGWNTQSDGNGINYENGEVFKMGKSNVTLYANWVPLTIQSRTGPYETSGGWIFYDKGNYSDGWRYLEASQNDILWDMQWYNGSFTTTGATDTDIGKGNSNTNMIITSQGNGEYAAKSCYDYSTSGLGGIDDEWFLPSKEELNLIYLNLKSFGLGYFGGESYWSSSEINSNLAWAQDFIDGTQYNCLKDRENYIRAIRAF